MSIVRGFLGTRDATNEVDRIFMDLYLIGFDKQVVSTVIRHNATHLMCFASSVPSIFQSLR